MIGMAKRRNGGALSDGSIRYYDERARSLGTSSTSSGITTFYDARGNKIGAATPDRAATKMIRATTLHRDDRTDVRKPACRRPVASS
jgi:hypothetical protein